VNKPTPSPATKGVQKTPEVKQPSASDLGDPTPMLPAKKPTPAAKQGQKKTIQASGGETLSGGEDNDVGDLLLSMGDDGSSSGAAFDNIPEGSTVMDVPIPPGALDPAAANKEKPKIQANTQNAAKDILEKYMKRP